MNHDRTIKSCLRILLSLFIYAFGAYLSIGASIGVAPWDVLMLGISDLAGISYGTVCACTNLIALVCDIRMGERIGLGTIIDAVCTGYFVDFYRWLNPVQTPQTLAGKIIELLIGIFIMAIGTYLCMSAAQGCGPKDALLLGIGKRLPKVPIGAVQIGIQATVVILGLLAGGPVGIGTIISVIFVGTAMQIVFHLFHFDARAVKHASLLEALRGDYKD